MQPRPTVEVYQEKIKECEDLKRELIELQISSSKLQHQINKQQFSAENLSRSDSCVQTEHSDCATGVDKLTAAQLNEHVQKNNNSHLLTTGFHQETSLEPNEMTEFDSDELVVSMCPSGVEDCSIGPSEINSEHFNMVHQSNRDSGVNCDDDAFFINSKQQIQTLGVDHHNKSLDTDGNSCEEQISSLDTNGSRCISDTIPPTSSTTKAHTLPEHHDTVVADDMKMLNDPDVQREEELIAFKEECSRLFEDNLQMKYHINELQTKLSHGGIGMASNLFIIAPIIFCLIGYIIISPYL